MLKINLQKLEKETLSQFEDLIRFVIQTTLGN